MLSGFFILGYDRELPGKPFGRKARPDPKSRRGAGAPPAAP